LFAPGGQSTQLIIGATAESDRQVLQLSGALYHHQGLRRVYYSGYVPVGDSALLPMLKAPPIVRENRLYQADWLFRFYGFGVDELVGRNNPFLDLDIDPKLAFALRHYHMFPVDLNLADRELLLRVPGIGIKSADTIVRARRHAKLRAEHIRKMGVAFNKAKHFIDVPGLMMPAKRPLPERLRSMLGNGGKVHSTQLSLF